jgi:hypothetical protein
VSTMLVWFARVTNDVFARLVIVVYTQYRVLCFMIVTAHSSLPSPVATFSLSDLPLLGCCLLVFLISLLPHLFAHNAV